MISTRHADAYRVSIGTDHEESIGAHSPSRGLDAYTENVKFSSIFAKLRGTVAQVHARVNTAFNPTRASNA